jgi:hypothetical protein
MVGDKMAGGFPGMGVCTRVAGGMGGVLILLLSGCASLSCQPASMMVVKKEERARVDTKPVGFTSETGRLEEIRRPEIVRDYWVLDADGSWQRVSFKEYQAAEVGRPVEICR